MRAPRTASRPVASPILGGLAALLLGVPASLCAAVCPVPSTSYPTLASAIAAPDCDTVQAGPGTYRENLTAARDLTLSGAGSTLSIQAGALAVSGAATNVTLAGLAIDGTESGVAGCWTSLLRTAGGARIESSVDVSVTNSGTSSGTCRLFVDGFESAGTLAWSNRVP